MSNRFILQISIALVSVTLLVLITTLGSEVAEIKASEPVRLNQGRTTDRPSRPQIRQLGESKSKVGMATPKSSDEPDIVSVISIDNATDRLHALDLLLKKTHSPAEWSQVFSYLNNLTRGDAGNRYDAEWARAWRTLANRNPALAVSLLEKFSTSIDYAATTGYLIESWAQKNFDAAAKWLQANNKLNDSQYNTMIATLVGGLAKDNLDSATKYALNNLSDDKGLFALAAKQLSLRAFEKNGLKGVQDWLGGLPSNDARRLAFSGASEQIKKQMPSKYKEWLNEQSAAPYRNDQVYYDWIAELAKTDPRAAMEQVWSWPLSPNDGDPTGYGAAIRGYINTDLPALADFYNQLANARYKGAIEAQLKKRLRDPSITDREMNIIKELFRGVNP